MNRNQIGALLRGPLAPLAGLALVIVIFTVWGALQKPDVAFMSGFRLSMIAKQTAIVGMGAVGMTAVIAAGGIDLSVGSLLALCSVVLASVMHSGADPATAVLAALLVGAAAGALNGKLITLLKLAPFVVTLGTMLIYRGLAEQVSSQLTVRAEAPRWIAALLEPVATSNAPLVSWGVWIVIGAACMLSFVLRRSVFGRHVTAVGANENAARLCGVPIRSTKILVYAIAGFCTAMAGIFEFANLGSQGSPSSGVGWELEVIAAVVIGGGSLSGGRGSVFGSLIGATMMTTLRSGCVYVEIPDPVQKVVTGAIILAAVALDRSRAR
ncbi:MAG: ABC transporter permease [Planctomycetes bacterium]|nr:ABC transporter permease [Planctomycetota bacterium]